MESRFLQLSGYQNLWDGKSFFAVAIWDACLRRLYSAFPQGLFRSSIRGQQKEFKCIYIRINVTICRLLSNIENLSGTYIPIFYCTYFLTRIVTQAKSGAECGHLLAFPRIEGPAGIRRKSILFTSTFALRHLSAHLNQEVSSHSRPLLMEVAVHI